MTPEGNLWDMAHLGCEDELFWMFQDIPSTLRLLSAGIHNSTVPQYALLFLGCSDWFVCYSSFTLIKKHHTVQWH